ncbi:MAG: hypothetical protein ACTS8H_00190 [Arsenophonus sp. NC-PE1-MAG3]
MLQQNASVPLFVNERVMPLSVTVICRSQPTRRVLAILKLKCLKLETFHQQWNILQYFVSTLSEACKKQRRIATILCTCETS